MNGALKNLFIFSAGAAVGSVVTWRMLKNRYEKLVKEEIDSVREKLGSRKTSDEATEEKTITREEKIEEIKQETTEYSKMLSEVGYTPYSDHEKIKEEGDMASRPYVIPPEEFGENEDYETESLTYYADGTLADDSDNVIEDVDFVVGKDSLTHFGEYEDDSVFVRNDRLKCDYEILLDVRSYVDAMKTVRPAKLEE